MRDGYVKAYRKMLDNPVVMKDAEHFAVWMWLLLNATHGKYNTIFKGEKVTLSNGQMVTGRLKIAQELKISESKVERILKAFESEQQIEQQKSNKNRLITVLKWREYQKSEQQNEQQLNNNWTTTEQQLNTYKNIYNNTLSDKSSLSNSLIENVKNDKNDNNPPTPLKRGRTKKESNLVLLDDILRRNPQTVLPEEVVTVMREWMEYKDQRKEHYVEKGMKSLLTQTYEATKQYGAPAVIECVQNSMACNYQGVIFDKLKRSPAQRVSNQQHALDKLAEYGKQFLEGDDG